MSFAFRRPKRRAWLVLAPLVDILALLVFFFLVYGTLGRAPIDTMSQVSADTRREIEQALALRVDKDALYISEAKAMLLSEGRFFKKSILPSGKVHPLTNMMRSLHQDVQQRFRHAPVQEAVVSIRFVKEIPFGTISKLVLALKDAGFKHFRYDVSSAR